MKFPHVQYMVGIEVAGEVKYFTGISRTAAIAAAGNPTEYFYVRFDRGPIMQPNGKPAPLNPYKSKREVVGEG